jgi:hypothetical protein
MTKERRLRLRFLFLSFEGGKCSARPTVKKECDFGQPKPKLRDGAPFAACLSCEPGFFGYIKAPDTNRCGSEADTLRSPILSSNLVTSPRRMVVKSRPLHAGSKCRLMQLRNAGALMMPLASTCRLSQFSATLSKVSGPSRSLPSRMALMVSRAFSLISSIESMPAAPNVVHTCFPLVERVTATNFFVPVGCTLTKRPAISGFRHGVVFSAWRERSNHGVGERFAARHGGLSFPLTCS